MKKFKGKALYQPSGKAAEYSPWACNFYTGCSNDCDYCYCKRGVMAHVWDNKPHLKKCFLNEDDALATFIKELDRNLDNIGNSGILFSFTTDPMLPETKNLTLRAMEEAVMNDVPVKILTKRADWLDEFIYRIEINRCVYDKNKHHIAFGFTLTGFDEKEPFADSNFDRIEALRTLHAKGFKTFASLEPIITGAQTLNMFRAIENHCDLIKIGLLSGVKKDYYNRKHMDVMWKRIQEYASENPSLRIYLKDSFVEYFGIERKNMPGNFVGADFNIFKEDKNYENKTDN